MNENHVYDMIIVGGGPGGYTSALYAARAGFDTIVLEKLSAGGQMSLTWQIDNYPGFENGIDGFSLAEKMQKQAEKFGAKSEYAEVYLRDYQNNHRSFPSHMSSDPYQPFRRLTETRSLPASLRYLCL